MHSNRLHIVAAVILASVSGCAAAWILSNSVHLRLFSLLLAILAVAVAVAVGLAGAYPRRRRVLVRLGIAGLVMVLVVESSLAYSDWKEGWQPAPVQAEAMFVRNPVCGYRLKPSRRYELWDGVLNVDRNGFRATHDVARTKETGQVRIMLVGSSTAFGWGVPDGQEVATQLREQLNAGSGAGRYEVINACVPYYSTLEVVNYYRHVLAGYEPDVLVTLDGRNDIWVAADDGRDWRPAEEGGVGRIPLCEDQAPLGDRAVALLMRSAVYRRMFWRMDSMVVKDQPPPPKREPDVFLDPRAVAQFVKHWKLLAADAQRQGVRCVLVLEPVIHCGKTLTERESENRHMWGDHGEIIKATRPRLREAVASLGGTGVVVADFSEIFADFSEDAYLDECHFNAAGSRRIAAKLADLIRRETPQ